MSGNARFVLYGLVILCYVPLSAVTTQATTITILQTDGWTAVSARNGYDSGDTGSDLAGVASYDDTIQKGPYGGDPYTEACAVARLAYDVNLLSPQELVASFYTSASTSAECLTSDAGNWASALTNQYMVMEFQVSGGPVLLNLNGGYDDHRGGWYPNEHMYVRLWEEGSGSNILAFEGDGTYQPLLQYEGIVLDEGKYIIKASQRFGTIVEEEYATRQNTGELWYNLYVGVEDDNGPSPVPEPLTLLGISIGCLALGKKAVRRLHKS